jgi:hypothetical protein
VTRADWKKIIIAFLVLAVLWAVGGFIAAYNVHTLVRHQHEIDREQDALVELAVNTTASLCLQDFATDAPGKGHKSEAQLVEDYVHGREIPLDQFGPTCPAAVKLAKEQIQRAQQEK